MAYRLVAKFEDQTFRAALGPGRTVVGSDPACEICLPNSTVSRRHAVITSTPGGFLLEDLGSKNGTLLRSRRIDKETLKPGDIFVIGRAVILLEEVPEEDLEVGIIVPQQEVESMARAPVSVGEATESFSPLDRFSLDALPRLLERLASGVGRERLAQRIGFTLFDTLPVLQVEIIERQGDRRGILYSAEHAEDSPDKAHWIEAVRGGCQIKALFFSRSLGQHYAPLVESVALMLALAERERSVQQAPALAPRPAERPQPPTVIPEVRELYEQAERVARGDVGILIYGESGTGKEVLASFIHGASPRATFPLVAINCASLPRDLLEAELFGVEKGVATGVEARPGKFETADQGTIFLDEIGDMAPETQAKILRVLQEKEVFRIGGSRPQQARARVIAATNRPIHKMLEDGSFRDDLYHRIATWEVELPPLRRRRADIPNLAAYFLAWEAQRYGIQVRGISRAALEILRGYAWPGNIRQLRNEIARAILFLEEGELLDTARLSPALRHDPGRTPSGSGLAAALEAVEKDEISAALDACDGDTAAAAKRLAISRPTLYRRLKSLGIQH